MVRKPHPFPTSVYRLQLSKGFGFKQAARRLSYLQALGVDAVYLSPIFRAAPGSPHGYDVVDHNALNGELGSPDEYEALCAALNRRGMRQIVDWVPNHMGVACNENALWLDVLENGPASAWADFFDIDWEPAKPELKNRVLLPILTDFYGKVLEEGGIRLERRRGAFFFRYGQRLLPLAPECYPLLLEGGSTALSREERAELLSIRTAFHNLPPRQPLQGDALEERDREKEMAKGRLAALAERSGALRSFIAGRLSLFNGTPGDVSSFDRLDELLDQQAYRLAHWKVASEEINYRRFFNINDLACLRMEDERVFEHCHGLLLRLIRKGKIHGLRIDHPDGLREPAAYLARLRRACADSAPGPFYIVVEKILGRNEALPDWPVEGTVGYEFLNAVNGLFVESRNEAKMDEAYASFAGAPADFDSLLYRSKKFFAADVMASEVHALGFRLDRVSELSRHFRDFTRYHLTLAIREIIDCFPVYRSYLSPSRDTSARDARNIRIAVEKAKRKTPEIDSSLYDFLLDLLLGRLGGRVGRAAKELYEDIVLRLQQLTAPVMAKGMEDTAFYAHGRLIALNEVGGDPGHFGASPGRFHRQNLSRRRVRPYGLLASSTHDTKRSEDARLRIAALSEIPEEWISAAARWSMLNEKHRTSLGLGPAPDRNTEYFLYQTLVGVWPDSPPAARELPALLKRLWAYLLKALRETKNETNWVNPNLPFEEACRKFLAGLLEPGNLFLADFEPFQRRISRLGKLNSISALTLKLGSVGVVDTYQGTEAWNYRLVDPDNRVPVDYDALRGMLASWRQTSAKNAAGILMKDPGHARVKLFVLWKGLLARRRYPELFLEGDYIPLQASGSRARHVVAFLRRSKEAAALVAAGRLFAGLEGPEGRPDWGDTALELPDWAQGLEFRNIWTEKIVRIEQNRILVSKIFTRLQAALLISSSE